MSWNFVRADNEGLKVLSTPVIAAPFTVCAWAKTDDAATAQHVIALVDESVKTDWSLYLRGSGAGDPVSFYAQEPGGTFGLADTTAGYTINVWQHICGIEYAANSRAVFINGANKGTNATNLAPAGADAVYIGRNRSVTTTINGYVAEVALWNIALSDAQVAQHASGMLANRIQPANLVAWWMLLANTNDYFNVYNLSDVATPTWNVDHPRLSLLSLRAGPVPVGIMRGVTRVR